MSHTCPKELFPASLWSLLLMLKFILGSSVMPPVCIFQIVVSMVISHVFKTLQSFLNNIFSTIFMVLINNDWSKKSCCSNIWTQYFKYTVVFVLKYYLPHISPINRTEHHKTLKSMKSIWTSLSLCLCIGLLMLVYLVVPGISLFLYKIPNVRW